jgi:hypothetical protein
MCEKKKKKKKKKLVTQQHPERGRQIGHNTDATQRKNERDVPNSILPNAPRYKSNSSVPATSLGKPVACSTLLGAGGRALAEEFALSALECVGDACEALELTATAAVVAAAVVVVVVLADAALPADTGAVVAALERVDEFTKTTQQNQSHKVHTLANGLILFALWDSRQMTSMLFQFDAKPTLHSNLCSCSSRYLTWLHSLATLLRTCLLGQQQQQSIPLSFSLPLPPINDDSHSHDEPNLPPPPPPYTPLVSTAECSQWLLGALHSLSVRTNVFVPRVLSHCTSNVDAARALAALLCDERARDVAALLQHDAALMRRFFTDSDERLNQRIAGFFGNFEWTGRHRLGSEPLARFLMQQRTRLWSHLQWLGNKRGVPPPVAAQKPQSFLQLDVQHAVGTLLRDDGDFWRFQPLVEAFHCEELIQLDPPFFVNVLVDALRRNDTRVLALAHDSLQRANASDVCARILGHLPPNERAHCFYGVATNEPIAVGAPPSYVRRVQSSVLSEVRWQSYDALILCWALVSRMRMLMSLASSDGGGWRALLLAWSAARRAHVDRATLTCGYWKVSHRVAAERDHDTRLRQTAGLMTLEGAALWLDMTALQVDAGQVLRSGGGNWRQASDERKRGRDDANDANDAEWTLRDVDDKTFVFGGNELLEQAVYQWQSRARI